MVSVSQSKLLLGVLQSISQTLKLMPDVKRIVEGKGKG